MKGVLGRDWGGMEPECSTRLAASLPCLALNCPLEAQCDLAFLEPTQGPTECVANHRMAYSAAIETQSSVCFGIWTNGS